MEYKFTDHAVSQFILRSHKLGMGKAQDPIKTMQKLLDMAIEEPVPKYWIVKRLIANKFKPVRYLKAQGWRFIISENDNIVITVERSNSTQN